MSQQSLNPIKVTAQAGDKRELGNSKDKVLG